MIIRDSDQTDATIKKAEDKLYQHLVVTVCVCVCVREREREREQLAYQFASAVVQHFKHCLIRLNSGIDIDNIYISILLPFLSLSPLRSRGTKRTPGVSPIAT